MARTRASGGKRVQHKINLTTAEASQLAAMPLSPDWNTESFEADLKEAFDHLEQARETSNATAGPAESAAIERTRPRLLQLKQEMWPANVGLQGYCKHRFGPIPVERLSTELDGAIAAWEPESRYRRTSRFLVLDLNLRRNPRLLKMMSAEFRETSAFKAITEALAQCFPVAIKQSIREKKVEHYMNYGQALKQSNAWREQMVADLGELTVELHDRVIGELVLAMGSLPSRLLFRDECHKLDFQDRFWKKYGFKVPENVDSFYEPISTLDRLSNFVLQGLGHVQLITPSVYTPFSSDAKRHPGFSVDVKSAALLSKKAVDWQLAKKIGVVAGSTAPIFGLPRTSLHATTPSLPTSLVPYGKVIRDLTLVITIPESNKPRIPNQVFGTLDMLPNLKASMPSLTHFRLTVAAANWGRDGSSRAPYFSRDKKTEMTSEEILMEVIVALRAVNIKERSIAHVTLNGPKSIPSWKESDAAAGAMVEDLKSTDKEEVAARLLQSNFLAVLV